MSAEIGQRYRRTWFPDEQVPPERVLELLRTRRRSAVDDPDVIPWMSSSDIGIHLGLVKDHRWRCQGEDLLTPNPKVCHRAMPHGLRWRHVVGQRDVRAALNHYQAQGTIIRLPHPLATWGVYLCPLDDADRAGMLNAWTTMADAREDARHLVQKYRIRVGQHAGESR
jgi:hypothetical protein